MPYPGKILVDVRPTHKGDAMRAFVREKGVTTVYTLPYTVRYFTREMPFEYAQRTAFEARAFRPHVQRGRQGYIVSFHANRRDYKQLRKTLLGKKIPLNFYGHYNVSQMLRWLYPVLSAVEIRDKRLAIAGKPSVEELMEETKSSLDIETRRFRRTDKEIYSATLISDRGDHIFTLLDPGSDAEEITYVDDRTGEARTATVHSVSKPKDIPRNLSSALRTVVRPLVIGGHNEMSYDHPELRDVHKEGKEDIYTPGVDGTDPAIQGGFGSTIEVLTTPDNREVVIDKQFARKTRSAGIIEIDTYAWARNNVGTVNRKHETIARLFDTPFVKGMDYDYMEMLAERAETDPATALELLNVNHRDAVNSFNTVNFVLPVIFAVSLDTGVDPTTVCFKSPAGLSRIYHDAEFYRAHHRYRKSREIELVGFSVGREKLFHLGLLKRGEDGREQRTRAKIGPQEAVVSYVPFYEDALGYVLQKFVNLWKIAETDSKPVRRVFAMQMLQQFADEMLFDLPRHRGSPYLEEAFRRTYGIPLRQVEAWVERARVKYSRILEEAGIINYSHRYVFTQREPEGSVVLGRGRGLSIAPESIMVKLDNQLVTQGIDGYFVRGFRTEYERDLLREVVGLAIEEGRLRDALEHLSGEAKKLNEGLVDPGRLVYSFRARMNAEDHSALARGKRTRMVRSTFARKGQKVERGLRIIHGKVAELDAPQFLSGYAPAPLAVEEYRDRMFNSGRSAEFIDALFGEGEERTEALQRILDGEGTQGDIEAILRKQNMPQTPKPHQLNLF